MAFDFVMGMQLVKDAYRHGMTVSRFLEELDPTSNYPAHQQGMDAFQRQLARYDIRTASDYLNGVPAHTCARFYDDDELGSKEERSALFGEWMSREYRKYTRIVPRRGVWSDPSAQTQVRFPLQDVPTSFTLYPPEVLRELRYQQLAPSALNVLIARQRMISSETFTALYLNDSQAKSAAHMSRVEEYAQVPTVRFDSAEQSARVKKYGRRLQMSYEQARRMQIDMLSWGIAYIAQVADLDKEAEAVDILINGDGNSGTAATSTNGSTLDAAAAGAMTLKMWLRWRFKWARPYSANVIVAPESSVVTALLLQAGTANLAPTTLVGSTNPQAGTQITLFRNTLDGIVAVDNTGVSANTVLGLDSRWTLEMVSEAGADIIETDRIMSAQYSEVTLTESVGFCIATKGQNQILAYTA